jgi:Fe-S cluster biogenesis protein NfuA
MCENCGCSSGSEKSFNDKVTEVIEAIRPMLQNDGGDIELVGIDDDNTVRVRLQGACKGCPGAARTLKMGVERILRERVADVKEVVAVA